MLSVLNDENNVDYKLYNNKKEYYKKEEKILSNRYILFIKILQQKNVDNNN